MHLINETNCKSILIFLCEKKFGLLMSGFYEV